MTSPLARAQEALEGLSTGDAFGERFFDTARVAGVLRMWGQIGELSLKGNDNPLGRPPWPWTDDTALAVEIVRALREHGGIDRDALAVRFAQRYAADPRRGYGSGMHRLLPHLRWPGAWATAAGGLFNGQGSYGNGAAMRVPPVGAYFADDLPAVVENARRSAEVTHAHPEGIAGAVAVAIAAALAYQQREAGKPEPAEFLDAVQSHTAESQVAMKIRMARDLPPDMATQAAAGVLGNGGLVTAQDTVPFVLWCAARYLDNYEEALWQTVRVFGDMDTNCAIVGGIVVMFTGLTGIPEAWRENREPLPA